MITEYLSDNEKIDFINECMEEKDRGNPIVRILVSSIIITVILISLLLILDPNSLSEYPYMGVVIFLITIMATSIFFDVGMTPAIVYYKYVIKVSNENIIVKMYSIVNIESTFIHPLRDIGGVGISEKTQKIKCGKLKTQLKGKVIEIYNKNGRKIFEFGFWMNEYDVVRLYEDLAAVLSLRYHNRMRR